MANPAPDFDNIAAATATLNTELPRIRNIQGVQGTQAILDQLAAIRNELTDIKTEIRRNSNDFIRLQNSQRYALNPATTLIVLRSLRTRNSIASPTTVAEIDSLTRTEARNILRELQQPVPQTLAARKDAIRRQIFLN